MVWINNIWSNINPPKDSFGGTKCICVKCQTLRGEIRMEIDPMENELDYPAKEHKEKETLKDKTESDSEGYLWETYDEEDTYPDY